MPFPNIPSRSRLLGLLLSLGLVSLSLPTLAAKADRDQPMQIEADSMRHDETKLLTQFLGRVVVTKGSLVLRAARMEVLQDNQGRQRATLWSDGVERVFFRQRREGLNEYTEGQADQILYDTQADTVTLVQNAEVRVLRGTVVADQLHGHTIVFNNLTEVMTVDGQAAKGPATGQGDRVRAILTPRTQPSATPDLAPAPSLRTSPGLAPRTKP